MMGSSHPFVRMSPVVGHRGAAALAPENTLAGLVVAKQAGAQWVEVDVRLSRDGDLVVFHDDNLLRTTGLDARVIDTATAEIAELDAGAWFSPDFKGEPIPMLADVWSRARQLGLGINLEIKATRCDDDDPDGEALLAGSKLAEFFAHVPDANAPAGGLLVSSFAEPALRAFSQSARGVAMALNLDTLPADWLSRAQALVGVGAVHLGAASLNPQAVTQVLGGGFGLGVFTVNDLAEARQLWDWGVWSVFSDHPEKLIE